MEKRLLAVLAVIAFVIMYIGPIILAALVVTGIVMGSIAVFKKYPKGISRTISYLVTPLLVTGWIYLGYVIYANDYCNTYKIRFYYGDYLSKPGKDYTITSRTEEAAYIEAWKYFMSENKNDIKASKNYSDYQGVLEIWNLTKNEKCYPWRNENIKSLIKTEKLYYGMSDFNLIYITKGW